MPKKQPLEQRFWSKVGIGRKNECWEWKDYKDKDGYGTFWLDGSDRRAHRVAYEITKGKIPEGKCCCHFCDNPSCVNPNHLWIGTSKENTHDAIKNRIFPMGENHWKSRLTETQIKQIRALRNQEGKSLAELSNQFGVTKAHIWQVSVGKSWKHVL
jgi:hypothetical protein